MPQLFVTYFTILSILIIAPEEIQRSKGVSKLTVGARALCKHAHRSSEGFWGTVTGTELEKNEMANNVAANILEECVFINVHILPHNEPIIEVSALEHKFRPKLMLNKIFCYIV